MFLWGGLINFLRDRHEFLAFHPGEWVIRVGDPGRFQGGKISLQ